MWYKSGEVRDCAISGSRDIAGSRPRFASRPSPGQAGIIASKSTARYTHTRAVIEHTSTAEGLGRRDDSDSDRLCLTRRTAVGKEGPMEVKVKSEHRESTRSLTNSPPGL